MVDYIWGYSNWPAFTWRSDRLIDALGQARFEQGKLLSRVNLLGMPLTQEARAEILIEETVKTAKIEGQVLSRDSVRSSVALRLGLPVGGLPASGRHVDGLVDVLLDATQNYQDPLTVQRLQSWQAALFPTGYSGLKRIRTGKWRGNAPMRVVSGPVGREKIHYEAPPSERIDPEIQRFLTWWNKVPQGIDGLLRAGIAHFWFVTIHPFEDGNGRIARALTDMAIAQDEKTAARLYSLSSQIMAERSDYYDILEQCQKGDGDITPWLGWFLGCLHRAILASQRLIKNTLTKSEFWHRHGHKIINARQRKVINRLLDAGKGGFEGGLTTRKYVSMAKVSRATAFREISDLVGKGMLLPHGGGRSVCYDIAWADEPET